MMSKKLFERVLLSRVHHSYGYATAQKLKPETASASGELHSDKLVNGVKVVSSPNQYPICRLSIAFRAGVRYEDCTNEGITHLFRHITKHSSQKHTLVLNTKSLNQLGVHLESIVDRDLHIVSADFHRSLFDDVTNILVPTLLEPQFYPWELGDTSPFILEESHMIRGTSAQLMDLLHYASFKGSLGHSLVCSESRIGAYSTDDCQQFYHNNYRPDRLAIACLGASSDKVGQLSKTFSDFSPTSKGSAANSPIQWWGSEFRRENRNPSTMVGVAVQGKGINQNEGLIQSVLAASLGAGPHVKYSSGTSRLQAVAEGSTSSPVSVSTVNQQYVDTGLFGFFICGDYNGVGDVVNAVYKEMKTAAKDGLSADEVQRGKNIVKLSLMSSVESQRSLSERLVRQSLLCDSADLEPSVQAVEKITAEQVNTLFKSLVKGTKSMASMGRLDNVPYKDELDAAA